MKRLSFLVACLFPALLHAQSVVTLEPDAFPHRAVLNSVTPGISLITVGSDNLPHPPQPFNVTAATSMFPFSPPTGSNVFAHSGVTFWNDNRRLRIDFTTLVTGIAIDFQGGNALLTEIGRLEAYGTSGNLLEAYSTSALRGGQVETMTIDRGLADVAWAVAWTLPGDSSFGRLDHLVVTVPEPSIAMLAGISLVAFAAARKLMRHR